MRKIYLLMLCLVALALMEAPAQESVAPAREPTAPTATSVTQPKAQPAVEAIIRDPFWPPDYWPQKKDDGLTKPPQVPGKTNEQAGVQVPVEDNVVRWPELKVKGLIKQLDGSYGAMIEGVPGMVEAGQNVPITRNGMVFRFKIKAINEKGIVREKLDYKPARR